MTALDPPGSPPNEESHGDPRRTRPYGDKWNDGAVPVSFTLPLPASADATEAARRFVAEMGIRDPYVTLAQPIDPRFTFFIVYGKTTHAVDATAVEAVDVEAPTLSRDAIDRAIEERLRRRIVVLGCALESDAHTVGLDAIFNMKGFAGDYGLERYAGFEAWNLGAQVPIETVVRRARETGADAILVSSTVTQNDIHVRHMTDLVDMLEAERLRDRLILVAGGARIDHALAQELGYDAGFGPGTTASKVAAFLLEEMTRRSHAG
jgi:beta-lysine 5,6-aminomutase beta subunit